MRRLEHDGCGHHYELAYRCISCARSARPLATEVNSLPLRTRSAVKRVSKILRTAGTNDVPPVRKTRSTLRASTPHRASRPSTHCSIASQLLGDPAFELGAGDGDAQFERGLLKVELGALAAG